MVPVSVVLAGVLLYFSGVGAVKVGKAIGHVSKTVAQRIVHGKEKRK